MRHLSVSPVPHTRKMLQSPQSDLTPVSLIYKLIWQKPTHFFIFQTALPVSFLQVFIVLGMYSFGSTLPHFQQIPLTARHMLGKVFLSSLFLWHVMPFSPKKLWTDFFYYEKTWNGITCNLHMRFILPSGGVFFLLFKLPLAMFISYLLSNFCHQNTNFARLPSAKCNCKFYH